MNNTKALRLAEFLETKVKPSWFDMSWWATKGFTKKECGTTACAMGWATVAFPRSALFLDNADETDIAYCSHWSRPNVIAYKKADGTILHEDDAIEAFFQLKGKDERFARIFWPGSYGRHPGRKITAKKVAARIRQYVNNPERIRNLIHVCEL